MESYSDDSLRELIGLLAIDDPHIRDLVTHVVSLPTTNKRVAVEALTRCLRESPNHAQAHAAFLLGESGTTSRAALSAMAAASGSENAIVGDSVERARKLLLRQTPATGHSWPNVLEGTFAPTTESIAFLAASVDDAARGYEHWWDEIAGRAETIEMASVEEFAETPYVRGKFRFEAPLTDALQALERVHAYLEKYAEPFLSLYLFVETQSAWTAVFQYCGFDGAGKNRVDLSGLVRVMSERRRMPGLRVVCSPGGGRFEAALIFAYETGKRIECRDIPGLLDSPGTFIPESRLLCLANPGSGTEFRQQGQPLPFEEREVSSRFTPEMMVRYCAALGIRPWETDYYGTKCWIYARRYGDPKVKERVVALTQFPDDLLPDDNWKI